MKISEKSSNFRKIKVSGHQQRHVDVQDEVDVRDRLGLHCSSFDFQLDFRRESRRQTPLHTHLAHSGIVPQEFGWFSKFYRLLN